MISTLKKLAGAARSAIVAADGGSAFLSPQPTAADVEAKGAAIAAQIDEVQTLHDAAHTHSERRKAARLMLDTLQGQAFVVTFQLHGLLTRDAATKLQDGKARDHKRAVQQLHSASEHVAELQASLDSLLSKFDGTRSKRAPSQPETPGPGDLAAAWVAAQEAGNVDEAQRIAAEIERAAREKVQREDSERIASAARDSRHAALHQRVEAVRAELSVATAKEAAARTRVAEIEHSLAAIAADLANLAALSAEVLLRSNSPAGALHHRASKCTFEVGQSADLALALSSFGAKARVWATHDIARAARHFVEASRAVPSIDELLSLPADNPLKRNAIGVE